MEVIETPEFNDSEGCPKTFGKIVYFLGVIYIFEYMNINNCIYSIILFILYVTIF